MKLRSFAGLKSYLTMFLLIIMTVGMAGCGGCGGCTKVPAGNVGIEFHLLGGEKGVDFDVREPGRHWLGWNDEMYLFPTFTQNYEWKAPDNGETVPDESFNFQDKDGLELNADIGITYKLEKDKIPLIFQTYKKGIDEITDIFLRNMVRDALVKRTSTLKVDSIYGAGRAALIDSVQIDVKRQVEWRGIIVEKIYWIGRIKIPPTVKANIEAKIASTQKAMQRENELREAEAVAKKAKIEADGIAAANEAKQRTLTAELLQWEALQRWDGRLPSVMGSGQVPFINIKP